MTTVTVKTDLRHLFGAARDQHQRPTCLAFAASDAHAALRKGWIPLSCEYAFFHAQMRAGRQANVGALLPSMLGALREDGQPTETAWPYLRVLPSDPKDWRPPTSTAPVFRRASEQKTCSMDALVAQLDRGVPTLVLMYLSRSFYMRSPVKLLM
jgi:hypothetical protein